MPGLYQTERPLGGGVARGIGAVQEPLCKRHAKGRARPLRPPCQCCRAPEQPTWTRGEAKHRGAMLTACGAPRGPAAGARVQAQPPLAETTPGFCLSTNTRPRFPGHPAPPHDITPHRAVPEAPTLLGELQGPASLGLDSPAGAWTGLQLPEQPQEPHRHEGAGPPPGHGTSSQWDRGLPSLVPDKQNDRHRRW